MGEHRKLTANERGVGRVIRMLQSLRKGDWVDFIVT